MSIASFARKLADAGLDAAAIVAALEAYEAAEEERKAKVRVRKQRQREREAVTERDVTPCHATNRDPSLPLPPSPQTPQPPTPTHPENTPRARKGGRSTDFDAFWSAYPKKKSKDTAAKAFAKAMGRIADHDPLAVILAGIERALPGWDDPRFIPYPATWLNAAGWEDEAPTIAKPRPERPANDRPDRFAAKQSNYDAAFAGADWADQVLASRRTF